MEEEKKCCCEIHAGGGQVCPNCPIHPSINPHLKPRSDYRHPVRDVNTGGKL